MTTLRDGGETQDMDEMPNPVHLILVPDREKALARALL